ncbi:MAG: T9SS type A sorting domain-containing protein [Bacteroidetes bacterium]|nr:T9SS type A sorting domain-containing protein [Bacteroidota bacterium]
MDRDIETREKSRRMLELIMSVLTIFLTVFWSISSAQSISTIGEIYDFEVGDVFHTTETGQSIGGFREERTIQIIDKYYSTDSNTVYYKCDISKRYSGSDQPYWSYDSFQDIISYSNLDSLLNHGEIDTVMSSSQYYGRKLNYYHNNQTMADDNYCIEGCGGPYYHLDTYYSDMTLIHNFDLVYYQKGTETWGTPNWVNIDEPYFPNEEMSVFPNPCSEMLFLIGKIEKGIIYWGMIYSVDGRLVKRVDISNLESHAIDVSDLKPGLYNLVIYEIDKTQTMTFLKK